MCRVYRDIIEILVTQRVSNNELGGLARKESIVSNVELLKQWFETDGKKTYNELAGTMYINPLYLFVEWLDKAAQQSFAADGACTCPENIVSYRDTRSVCSRCGKPRR